MKICLSRFWYIGIVAQDFQSWKDATIIGWFTTMTMIKNILIMTVIAALVPTAMSNVSASADAEIALFSTASVDTDSLSISGNGDSAKMKLKATNDNGKSNRVSDFHLTADNVLSTKVGDKVTVLDNVDFTKAITTDARNNQKAIGITSNGVIDFAGYTQGVYTLDVVVDDDRAYEAIIAMGDQTNQIVDKEITRVNSDYRIEFVFPPIKDPKPPVCKEGYILYKGECLIDDYDCEDASDFEDPRCAGREPPEDECEPGYRLNDEGECEQEMYCISEMQFVNGKCEWIPGFEPIEDPEPEPIPVVNCYEGWHEDASGTCQSDDQENPTMPSCELNPNQPDCETTSESLELATLPEDEELPEEEEQELDDSEEELDGELEEEESEEDESGESEDEVQDEDSGEESEGESEEENGGGN
jgi:hypothetical protein